MSRVANKCKIFGNLLVAALVGEHERLQSAIRSVLQHIDYSHYIGLLSYEVMNIGLNGSEFELTSADGDNELGVTRSLCCFFQNLKLQLSQHQYQVAIGRFCFCVSI